MRLRCGPVSAMVGVGEEAHRRSTMLTVAAVVRSGTPRHLTLPLTALRCQGPSEGPEDLRIANASRPSQTMAPCPNHPQNARCPGAAATSSTCHHHPVAAYQLYAFDIEANRRVLLHTQTPRTRITHAYPIRTPLQADLYLGRLQEKYACIISSSSKQSVALRIWGTPSTHNPPSSTVP
jgi:hypothetical protein